MECQNEESVALVEVFVKSHVFLVDLPKPHQVVSTWCVAHQL